jgi:hypothetical protein
MKTSVRFSATALTCIAILLRGDRVCFGVRRLSVPRLRDCCSSTAAKKIEVRAEIGRKYMRTIEKFVSRKAGEIGRRSGL